MTLMIAVPDGWQEMLIPSKPLIHIIVRGTVMYLALFLFLRLFKRESGAIGVSDLLVVVLIADAAQNAMASDYKSIPEGLVLVATIVFWDYTMDWIGYRFDRIGRILHPPPSPLIRNGVMLRRNMRREMISEDELMSQLREHGVADTRKVKWAYMEGDGSISVITTDGKGRRESRRHNPG